MVRWWAKQPLRMATAAQSAAAPVTEAKASRTGAVVALHSAGRPVWTPRNYAALTRAG